MLRSFVRLVKITLLLSCLVPLVVMICTRLRAGYDLTASPYLAKVIAMAAACLVAAVAGWWFISRESAAINDSAERQAAFLDTMDARFVSRAIFLSAALSLFLELVIIRWQGTMFPLFSFYKNFSLLACFAGLGLGYALSNRGSIPLILVAPLVAFQVGIFTLMRDGLGLTTDVLNASPIPEQLNMGLDIARGPANYVALYFFLAMTFLLTALMFIPVGQLCGRLMERQSKLRAYGWNLLGSLCGVIAIMALSVIWSPPVIWFGVALAGVIVFFVFSGRTLLVGALVSMLALCILALPTSFRDHRIYSPYQLLECGSNYVTKLLHVRAAGLFHQNVFDLRFANTNRNTDAKTKSMANYYEFPYTFQGSPGIVAVVGSGTGNDVAAALRMGARSVDAIEIDPAILALGKNCHPERPYSDKRVTAIVNDARTFLRNAPREYDMIVYGLLDSHAVLSQASSVRLDSFVYTVEGFREARARLKQGGILSCSFCVIDRQLGRKIYLMLQQAFDGRPPKCAITDRDACVVIFLARNGGDIDMPAEKLAAVGYRDGAAAYGDNKIAVALSTDDWPFFYMPARVYPTSCIGMAALVILLSLFLVGQFMKVSPQRANASFFFLGAGFMLVETKAITEMGLTFGNTWQVVAIVIAGLLTMAFLGNCFVAWTGMKNTFVPFLLLFASLAAGLWVARHGGLGSTLAGKVGTATLLTCPMFFSGIIFSTLLSKAQTISGVMAVNLIGSMLGGLLEYNSMYFGFQFLYVLGLGLYVLALVWSLAGIGTRAPFASLPRK